MTRRVFAYCAVVLLSVAGLQSGCGDTIAANNCTVNCQDVDNTCIQKCTDDACRTVCKTDLDNCTASCKNVTASPPSNTDGG